MPTYEYRCEGCGYEFEQFQSITAKSLKTCPNCKRRTLERLIGRGGGIIFKGSGFYETDYRSSAYKKAAAADVASPTPSSDSGSKTSEKSESTSKSKKKATPSKS
ncbi:MAG: zinc ribbon domain-containing protein [Phycisphaerae bacterium]|jgi:putative FmdB family regulatory protein